MYIKCMLTCMLYQHHVNIMSTLHRHLNDFKTTLNVG